MLNLDFFQNGPIPPGTMTGYFDYRIVALSYIIAVLASYVALEIAKNLRLNTQVMNFWYLLLGGACAMGAGIFTMHFVGMQAFIMSMPMEYDMLWTLLSFVIAIVASGFALFLVRENSISVSRILVGGFILGFAICGMHYTGMGAMLHVKIRYIPSLYLLSIFIAVTASFVALWMMFNCDKGSLLRQRIFKICSALIMGAAICGMHYTGMAAAVYYAPDAIQETMPIVLSAEKLSLIIIYIATFLMVLTLLFVSYKHLIFIKLLIGYGIIVMMMIPLGFISKGTPQSNQELVVNSSSSTAVVPSGDEQSALTFEMIIAAILFALFSSVFLSFQISRPILHLRDVANKIAEGDLSQKVLTTSEDEIGQLSRNFNDMVDKLNVAKRKRDEFMSMAAHDLRNPLFVITQGSSLLASESMGKLTEPQNKLVNTILKASSSMMGLLDALLTVNELDSNVFHIKREEVPLKEFFQDLFDFNQLLAKKKNIVFTMKTDFSVEVSFFDGPKVAQVINNLTNNAFKFSNTGSKVEMAVKADKSSLHVEIHDEAGGIPENEQNKIFTKFAKLSVKPTAGEATHGLGLAICKDIIQAHGGQIGFHSQPGKGSVFYFELDTNWYFRMKDRMTDEKSETRDQQEEIRLFSSSQ